MSRMIVVSDTSAITSLMQIGRESFLPQLFARILVPIEVRNELIAFHPAIPPFVEVQAANDTQEVYRLLDVLDRGEAEVIVLSQEQAPDLVIIDDLLARNVAISLGLPVIGLLGVLVRAKGDGHLESVGSVLSELEEFAGFRVSTSLKRAVMKHCGE